jgi:hypothetical protein
MQRSNLEVYAFAHPDADTWIIYFPWTTNPLPLNGSHGGWRKHAKNAKRVRAYAEQLISQFAKIPALGRCSAQVTWWFTATRVRDVDNLADLEKRLFDALVTAGVVDDDRPELMDKPRAVIRHIRDSNGSLTGPGFTLTVKRLPSDEATDHEIGRQP